MSKINPWLYPVKSPCWHIFNDLWMVKIPASYVLNPVEIKHFGVRVGNDEKKKDIAYSNALADIRDTMLTIADIACLMERFGGNEIQIAVTKDAVEMYKYLKDYLTAANKKWDNPLTINKPPPKEDLYILDRLAEALYPIASMHEEAPKLTTGFDSFLSDHGFYDHSGFKAMASPWALNSGGTIGKVKYEYKSPLTKVVGRGHH